jgi:hypothetical protein
MHIRTGFALISGFVNRDIGIRVSRRLQLTATAIRSLLLDLVLYLLGHGLLIYAAVHPCGLVAVVAGRDVERQAFIANRTLLIALFAPESTGPAAVRTPVHIYGKYIVIISYMKVRSVNLCVYF